MANMERIASGIWFMKSLIDGWSLMLGQNEPYSITSAPMLIAYASRLRRSSRRVLSSTLRSMVAAFAVVGEEGFPELRLDALEVDDLVQADPFQEQVQGRLGGAAGHGVVTDAEVDQAGHS